MVCIGLYGSARGKSACCHDNYRPFLQSLLMDVADQVDHMEGGAVSIDLIYSYAM